MSNQLYELRIKMVFVIFGSNRRTLCLVVLVACFILFATRQNPLDQMDYSQSHPLENQCRFPVLQPEEPDLSKYVRHYRAIRCPATYPIPLVTQLRNGQILFGKPHRNKLEEEVDCYTREISGTLKPSVRKVVELGDWLELPPNKRVSLQWHQFVVKCYYSMSRKLLFHDVFTNIPDAKPQYFPQNNANTSNYSISIFIIDSAAKSQFYRHMPLTLKFMEENDFQVFQGYTKIGDNSAINLLALLAGMIYEPEERG
uniref:Uncharacterized protein n=1 Tax=Ditylenchus dipsaci TaxID=166011 RepID=A0A915CY41_9BILA